MSQKRRKARMKQLHIRLYSGQDDELIEWLESLKGLPVGEKSRRIREALCRGIKATDSEEAGAPDIDLSEIRKIVEAAVAQALAGLRIEAAKASVEEDSETEEILENLGASLVLSVDQEGR